MPKKNVYRKFSRDRYAFAMCSNETTIVSGVLLLFFSYVWGFCRAYTIDKFDTFFKAFFYLPHFINDPGMDRYEFYGCCRTLLSTLCAVLPLVFVPKKTLSNAQLFNIRLAK